MNTIDLMPGDWVKSNYKEQPSTFHVYGLDIENKTVLRKYDGLYIPEAYVNPIPLNRDVLKKNFTADGSIDDNNNYYLDQIFLIKVKDSACYIYIHDIDDKHCYYHKILFKIKYIHELQHFLKVIKSNKEIEL